MLIKTHNYRYLHKILISYNFSRTQLLITNWLPFDLNIKFEVRDQNQWVYPFRPDLSLNNNQNQYLKLCSQSSIHSCQNLKPTLSPYMLGNLGNFSIEIQSQQYGSATFCGSQINAEGVSAYSLPFGLYQLRHRAGLKHNIYQIMGRGVLDNANWMKQLLLKHPDICLNQVVIPGSHDSGMIINRFSFLKRLTQNQYEDIFGQLVNGIRYFDLRFTKKYGKFYIYHGNNFIAQIGITLDSLIADVNSFLSHYGHQQTLIFNVSRTRSQLGKQDRTILIKRLTEQIKSTVKRSEMVCNKIVEQKLKNLKGKVLICFDSKDFCQLDSEHLIIDQIKGDKLKLTQQPNTLQIYDHYSNTNVIQQMVLDQNKKLSAFGGLSNNYLFLYSFTLTVQSKLRLSLQHYSIQLLGNISRAMLPIQLQKMRKGILPKPNIIFFDFIDSWSCDAIIKLNY